MARSSNPFPQFAALGIETVASHARLTMTFKLSLLANRSRSEPSALISDLFCHQGQLD
jgi:hypothetical protein